MVRDYFFYLENFLTVEILQKFRQSSYYIWGFRILKTKKEKKRKEKGDGREEDDKQPITQL